MKIADILNSVADNHLWDAVSVYTSDKCYFSCNAIEFHGLDGIDSSGKAFRVIMNLAYELGMPRTNGSQFFELEDSGEPTPEAQGARYMWLKLMALVASDRGL